MDTILTPRLELILLSSDCLEALLAGDRLRGARLGGFHIPEDLSLSKSLLTMRLAQIRHAPETHPWLVRAIVLRQSQTMCGHIGFHSPPGPEDLLAVAADGVELGYSVGVKFRRQGYAREAALALMHWAFTNRGQRHFVLSIAPDNIGSLAMAESLGFSEIGSHIDDEDGLELYFSRYLRRWPDEWHF